MKQKLDFPVGQKIRGYGLLNEFGEFDFIPEQTGSRRGVTKVIKEGHMFVVSCTKKKVLVHMSLPRRRGIENVPQFLTVVDDILNVFREYDI